MPPLSRVNGSIVEVTHLCRADSLAELASDTPLLSVGVPSQGVLSSEARTQRTLLKWVVQGGWLSEEGT